MEEDSLEVQKIQHDLLSPKSSIVSTRMPNPEAIAHWVNRVITFDDSLKNQEKEKQSQATKHTKAARSETFAAKKA